MPRAVALALSQAGIPDSHVAAVVQDIDAAEPSLLHGGERALNPASVMKLITTLAVLDTFGPAHTFKTRVLLDGPLRDGVLDGRLILQGGGDPALTRERFWRLLREIRARGVREIRGDVLIDSSYYQIDPLDPAAFDDAPLRPYNATPAALLVDFNTIDLRLDSHAGGVDARFDPALAAPSLDNQVRIVDGPCNGARPDMTMQEGTLRLGGPYPSACGLRVIPLNLLPASATAAAWFRELWAELGGSLQGSIVTGMAPPTASPLLDFDSPPLAQLVRDVNKYSNNVMAQMLYLNLGAAQQQAPATWDKAERALRDWLAARGIECGALVVENGAGLSRVERISAFALAKLLRWAALQPSWFEYAASLPAVGLEGTQKKRLKDSLARGQAWLKSGSLKDVRNLAGYARTPNGGHRVIVFLINHENAAAAGPAQDALVEWATDTLNWAAPPAD